MNNIKEKHNKLREILQEYNNPEWGDCIIDDICSLLEHPTTVDFEAFIDDESISFRDFYDELRDLDEGNWDGVNSEEIIRQYVAEKSREGYSVSHILKAIEENPSSEELYAIWLGNSMETPTPINTKEELYNALNE
jgi:hypothetical protein